MDLKSFIVAILPVFLIGLYIYKKDKDREPSKLLFVLFLFGVLSCFPAAFVGSLLSSFLPEESYMNNLELFIYVFIFIAFVEECCKWFATYKAAYNHNAFDTTYDMIVYAVFAALGFACFENVLYVSSYGIGTGLMRALLAVPGHACDGIVMGIYLGLAKYNEVNHNDREADKYKVLALVIPTITHGIYDYCLMVGTTTFLLIFFLFVISLDIYCIIKVREISKKNLIFKFKNRFCSGCGAPVNSVYCPKCGTNNK